jgi:hypothetical protein
MKTYSQRILETILTDTGATETPETAVTTKRT